jgi:peptide/nickel transport system permease protein
MGPQASMSDVERARHLYALDRPLAVQYARFWTRLIHVSGAAGEHRADPEHRSCAAAGPLHVDLGFSFQYRKPVVDLLEAKVPRSIELALAALVLQLALGIVAGVISAARRGSTVDQAAVGATLLGVSAPTFVIAVFLQYLFAYKWRLLPYDGYGQTAADHFSSLILPALTLAIFGASMYARVTRDELITILRLDYIRTARAKGASRARTVWIHGLRNALVPIAAMAALDLGTLVGGAIVTEQVFRWPGVGQMAVYALQNRDGPLIVGTVLFSSLCVVGSMLLLDAAAGWLDPRLRRPS